MWSYNPIAAAKTLNESQMVGRDGVILASRTPHMSSKSRASHLASNALLRTQPIEIHIG
jgi:hypothetical protein